tara:strand:- start:2 stop:133 length:132 start_codon:yes stop_codon:yes gene_type:complete
MNTNTNTFKAATAVNHIPLKGILEKDIVKGTGYVNPYKNGLWI